VKLLTLRQCAELTGTSERWWRRCVFERRIPIHKLGRLVRISEDDLAAFLTANRKGGEAIRNGDVEPSASQKRRRAEGSASL
jgi:excisionase family DNA binding protein